MSNQMDVAVIGGGPAGMMAAGFSAGRGLKTVLIEGQERPGRKLRITGKGRCNVTNACDEADFLKQVNRNSRFLFSAIHQFSPKAMMDFLEGLGLPLKVERGNRVYPASDQATDVVDALVKFVKDQGVKVRRGLVVSLSPSTTQAGEGYQISFADGSTLEAKAVVIATGGLSYPQTGSTGDGYRLAKSLGHNIIAQTPSLSALVTQEEWCKDMMGLSLKNVSLTVKRGKKIVFQDIGEMLFTHFGISGPLVLTASAYLDPRRLPEYRFILNWKPGLDRDALDKRLQNDFQKYANREFVNALTDLLPSKSIPVFVALSQIPPQTKVHQISKSQRQNLAVLFHEMEIHIKSFRPIEQAVITCGGVDVKEIDPKTMESKLVHNLFFAGEVLDLDAKTGGYNLQIAYATGVVAGSSVLLER